jgi:hypothetical protein
VPDAAHGLDHGSEFFLHFPHQCGFLVFTFVQRATGKTHFERRWHAIAATNHQPTAIGALTGDHDTM